MSYTYPPYRTVRHDQHPLLMKLLKKAEAGREAGPSGDKRVFRFPASPGKERTNDQAHSVGEKISSF